MRLEADPPRQGLSSLQIRNQPGEDDAVQTESEKVWCEESEKVLCEAPAFASLEPIETETHCRDYEEGSARPLAAVSSLSTAKAKPLGLLLSSGRQPSRKKRENRNGTASWNS